jgi:hypothetical protein
VKDDMQPKKPTGKDAVQFWGILFCMGAISGVIAFAVGDKDALSDSNSRILLCIGFLLVAYLSYRASETKLKLWIGLGKIGAALASDWFQLEKWANEGFHTKPMERLVWLAAGLAVLQSGVKDVVEGLRLQPHRTIAPMPTIDATSRSSGSSAVPTPEAPTPEANTQEHH